MTDFAATRALFHIPEGVVYLDGNSLGPLPLRARERVRRMLEEEWGGLLIRGWNDAGWIDQPRRLGDRIGYAIPVGGGLALLAVGAALFATIDDVTALRDLWLPLVLCGIGLGGCFATASAAPMSVVPPEQSGEAAGTINVSRYIGGALGVAVGGALFVGRGVDALGAGLVGAVVDHRQRRGQRLEGPRGIGRLALVQHRAEAEEGAPVEARLRRADAHHPVAVLAGHLEPLGSVRRHQDRVLEPRRPQVEQAAESAEIGLCAGPARRLGQGFEGRNQGITRIDIHTGIAVGGRGAVVPAVRHPIPGLGSQFSPQWGPQLRA